jgi:hypothetical protein
MVSYQNVNYRASRKNSFNGGFHNMQVRNNTRTFSAVCTKSEVIS